MRTRGGIPSLLFFVSAVGLLAEELDMTQIPLTFPPGFAVLDGRTREIRSPIPDQPATIEHSARLEQGNAEVFLFHWAGSPLQDYGPMAADEEWPATVAGQKARISRTRAFMGREQAVLVAHFELPGDHHFMIYSRSLDRPAFEAFLAQLAVRE